MTTSGERVDSQPPSQNDVRELTDSVYDLSAMITEVLAPGLERVQEDLTQTKREKVSRQESEQRARRSITLVLSAVLIALVLNTLFIVGVVVPKCYNNQSRGPGHSSCNLIPGYKKQRAESKELLDRFNQSQQDLADEIRNSQARQNANTARITQLEQRLGVTPPPPPVH